MKLIIMTKSTFFVEENQILEALFEAGLDSLHLYKPNSEPIYSERLLTLLADGYLDRITVHEHFYLKDEFHLRGIHLNNHTIEPPAGYRGSVTRTCHDISELQEAKKHSPYVFLKTIFDSQSNPADKSTHDTGQLRQAAQQGLIDKNVYAMGGINLDNLSHVRDIGFGGAVICGDLWNRFNIQSELDYKALIHHFEKLQKATMV